MAEDISEAIPADKLLLAFSPCVSFFTFHTIQGIVQYSAGLILSLPEM